MYVPGQVAGDDNAKYLRLSYSLSVCSVDMYGCEICHCITEINNKLFCLTFVDFHVILDCPQVCYIACFLEIWHVGVRSSINDACVINIFVGVALCL